MDPVRAVSYAGLAISTWDWINTWRAEYEIIWSRSLLKLNAAQILYFSTRYSAFLCHASHITIIHVRESRAPFSTSAHFCRLWFFYIIVAAGWTYGLLLVNLMLRTYALYELDSRVIFTLVVLLILKVVLCCMNWFYVLPNISFTNRCIPLLNRPGDMVIMVLIELTIQTVPVYLTLSRGAKLARAARAERVTKLISYLRRDGVISWAFITASSIIVTLFTTNVRNSPRMAPHTSHPLIIALVSSLGCHLILQMRKPGQDQVADVPDLTSYLSFELDSHTSSTWGTRTFGTELGEPVDPSEPRVFVEDIT